MVHYTPAQADQAGRLMADTLKNADQRARLASAVLEAETEVSSTYPAYQAVYVASCLAHPDPFEDHEISRKPEVKAYLAASQSLADAKDALRAFDHENWTETSRRMHRMTLGLTVELDEAS